MEEAKMFHKANRLLLLPLLLLLSSCNDPYRACVQANADVAQAISNGLATITQLQQQGLISTKEAPSVAGYFEFANKADETFGNCAKNVHTSGATAGSYTACAQAFNTSLNNPNQLALLHVSNTNASQTISIIVTGLTNGANSIITSLGGK
jgi:hypothetical protein